MKQYTDTVLDRNGNVVVGATVTVTNYPSGTSATVYSSDAVGSNANPLTTDSNGQFSFYAPNGYYTLTVSKTGITTTTQNVLIQDIPPSVLEYGAKGDGTTDDSTAIQAAIDANNHGTIHFPPGSYKILTGLTIAGKSLKVTGIRGQSTIYMGTQNMTALTIGSGTLDNTQNGTVIDGLSFTPLTGVTASASGACIACNGVADVKITNCVFYGKDGGTSKLFNGVTVVKGTNVDLLNCQFYYLIGTALRTSGVTGAGNRTVDCHFDYLQVYGCAAGFYFGDYTAGISANFPIMSGNTGWGIQVDTSLYNVFISQPDIESGGSGGINVKTGGGVVIGGGWFGGAGPGLQVDSTASGTFLNNSLVQSTGGISLSGSYCKITDCDIAGDSATTTTGIALAATATDTSIVGGHIRQWTTAGIAFTGSPARCSVKAVSFRSNTADITGTPSDINASSVKGSTTPTPTAGSGTITTATATINWTKESDRVMIDGVVSITTNGTGATDIRVPLPFTPAAVTSLSGVVVETFKSLTGYFNTTGSAILGLYDATYPGADGRTLRFSGAYRV